MKALCAFCAAVCSKIEVTVAVEQTQDKSKSNDYVGISGAVPKGALHVFDCLMPLALPGENA